MTSRLFIQTAISRLSELSNIIFLCHFDILKKKYLIIGSMTENVDISDYV